MQVNWSDPQTFWLNATNLALGVVVLVCLAVVAVALFQEVVRRRAESAALDREMEQLVAGYQPDGHAVQVPGLGLTMADGGEPVKRQDPPRR